MAQRGLFDGGDRKPRAKTASVTEVVRRANATLEREFAPLWVEGEVANLKLASSGHAYFSLRDESAVLSTAMWRASVQRLRFRLSEGQRLRVYGRLGIYQQQGRFQFYAERAEPAGLGELMLRLEQLKKKLGDEGLFDPAKKRPLPIQPARIGVVSSPTGAAIHDLLKVVRRRSPTDVLLSPARVQGDEAPFEIRRAIRRLIELGNVDVIVVARGGGSLEDLWAFNNEGVVRTVASSPIPIVSAVGHEVDVTLCDLAADVRAATPSHAGELVVPDRAAVRRRLRDLERALLRACERVVLDARSRQAHLRQRLDASGTAVLADVRGRVEKARHRLELAGGTLTAERRATLVALSRRLERQDPGAQVSSDRRRVRALETRLEQAMSARVSASRLRAARAAASLDALSPLRVLERGYALVSDSDGRVVRSAGDVHKGDALDVRLHEGRLRVRVDEVP